MANAKIIEQKANVVSEIKEKSYETEFNEIRKMLKSTNELIISAGEQDIETIKNTVVKSNQELINAIENIEKKEKDNKDNKLLEKRMDSIEEKVDSNYEEGIPNYIDYSPNESNDKLDT